MVLGTASMISHYVVEALIQSDLNTCFEISISKYILILVH